MRMVPVQGMNSALGVCFVIFLIAGCVNVPNTTGDQRANEGDKNLAAIRALLNTSDHRISIDRRPSGQNGSERSLGWPPDWNEAFLSSSSLERALADGHHRASSSRPDSVSPKGSSPRESRIYIPWRPSAPQHSETTEPFRPVPPYFSFTPAVPVFPGTWHCVPDFSGGQRCHPN